MQEASLSTSFASDHRRQQLLTLRRHVLAVAEQLREFSAQEPPEQQESWSEHLGMMQDVANFLDCAGSQDSGQEDSAVTKKQWQEFGELLRDRRDAAGMSRMQLARKAKVSDSTVKFTESARHPPSRKTLIRLLGVPELRLTWKDVPVRGTGAPLRSVPAAASAESQPNQAEGEAATTDLNWYVAPTFDPVNMVMDLGRFLNGAGGHVEQTNAYLDHQSAAAYLAMCQQSPLTAAFRRNIPLGAIAERIAQETNPAGLNVVMLGCGDAHLEVRLIQQLVEQQSTPHINMCLFDISQPLLSAGFKYATDTLGGTPGIHIWALQGNFHHLPLYTQLHGSAAGANRRRVFCMLGNTLANLDNEPRFFQYSLVDCVPGDLLVLDVQQAHGSVDHPAEIRRRDPSLGCPFPKTHADWFAGPIYRHCRDIVSVEFTAELETQCALPGSYALDDVAIVKSKGRPDRRFSMFRIKRYDVAKLAQCLAQYGWEQLAALPCGRAADTPSMVMLFCKRSQAAAASPRLVRPMDVEEGDAAAAP